MSERADKGTRHMCREATTAFSQGWGFGSHVPAELGPASQAKSLGDPGPDNLSPGLERWWASWLRLVAAVV